MPVSWHSPADMNLEYMGIIATALRELMAAGVAGEALAAAIERIEAANAVSTVKVSAGAERTRRWRENKASQSVTKRHRDVTVTRKRGERLSMDWQPTPDDITAAGQLLGLGWEREVPKFRDYWHSRAGPGAVKVDWSAVWRNWCRKAAEGGASNGSPHGSRKRTVMDAADDVIAGIDARIAEIEAREAGDGAGETAPRLLPPR